MSKKLSIFLFVSAIIMAMATFAVMLALNRRPDPGTEQAAVLTATAQAVAQTTGQQSFTLLVDNTEVTVRLAPGKEIRLLNELPPPETTQPQLPESEVPVDVLPAATLPPEPMPIPTVPPVTIAPTITPLPVVPAPVDPIIFIPYTVQPGDTLYTVAEAQRSSIVLMATYGIDANDLTPGVVINRLPVANPAYCPGYDVYVVREGDTAYSISRRFNTTHEFLRDLNKLPADYRINVGQVLCVP
ncbi:MAG: hypothetical protein Fur0021_16350 [Candidatus Promineifilaceae bacterium]